VLPDLTAFSLLSQSVKILLKRAGWTQEQLADRIKRDRQWVQRVLHQRQQSIPMPLIDELCSVFSEGLTCEITPGDLFQPTLLEQRLKNPVAFPVTPTSNTPDHRESPHAAALRAEIDRLERSDAQLTSIFFDVYTLLARHFESGDLGDLQRASAPLTKGPGRSGERRRKPRA
jgi:transcriptional regulator with XRE-family HTH domain